MQVSVHQSFCFMYFLCDYARPAVSSCVLRCVQAAVFAAPSTPCEVNIATLGKQSQADRAGAAEVKRRRQPAHKPFFIQRNNTVP